MRRSQVPRDPDAVIGGYELHLYCQHPTHDADEMARMECIGGPGDVPQNPAVITGETRGECLREARKRGWWISRPDPESGVAVLCPYHARQVPR